MWEVEFTDEFRQWYEGLDERDQDAIARGVELLQQIGPSLGRPYVDTVKASRHSHMKELRTQSSGDPIRTFFCLRSTTSDTRFYERMIPIADKLYDVHLAELRKEGLI